MTKKLRVSAPDKLRTIMGANLIGALFYTQKELASILGVSTRTLRRFKNQKDYRLSPRTMEKIKAPLDKTNRNFRRFIKDKALVSIKTRSHGRVRVDYKLQKIPSLKLPSLPIQPVPVLFTAKSGLSQTLRVDTNLWNIKQKTNYVVSAIKTGRYLSWTARIRVPVGVATSGDVESSEVNEGERPVHYMIGPFTLQASDSRNEYRVRQHIERELAYHQDAGREIVSVSIVENLPNPKNES